MPEQERCLGSRRWRQCATTSSGSTTIWTRSLHGLERKFLMPEVLGRFPHLHHAHNLWLFLLILFCLCSKSACVYSFWESVRLWKMKRRELNTLKLCNVFWCSMWFSGCTVTLCDAVWFVATESLVDGGNPQCGLDPILLLRLHFLLFFYFVCCLLWCACVIATRVCHHCDWLSMSVYFVIA